MSTVIFPGITNDVVIKSFESLVSCELRKHLALEFQEGRQDGYIACLEMKYGSNSDDMVFDEAYRSKNTWSHVTADIVDQRLSSWVTILECDTTDAPVGLDMDKMNKEVKDAVRWYALRHPEKMINAFEYL